MRMNFARMTAQVARAFGEREALVNLERGRRYTHAELHRLTNRIVNMMRERLDLRRGDVYMPILENDNLALLHTWTIFKGEAAAAWTNFRDSLEEHLWQVDFVQPKVLFLENALLDRFRAPLRERGVRIVCMDPLTEPYEGVCSFWELMEGVSDAEPGVENDVYEDVLNYRFTGGTTGRGKCAPYTLDNWLSCRDSFYAGEEAVLHRGTRMLLATSLSHGAGLAVLPTYFRGGCIVTQNTADMRAWRRNVATERITTGNLVPTLLYRLLESEAATSDDLSTLTDMYYGAAPMSPTKLAQLQARFGNIFVQIYGATECLQAVAMLQKAEHVVPEGGNPARLASAGRVMPGAEVMVVGDHGEELSTGEIGEIWIRGRSTIGGYHRNPEGSAGEFEHGFWKSGDLGYCDADGYLFIVDRKKDMIITGGFNVYAIEVENALNAHPAVLMSAVVGIPHAEWGEAVHAEVVLRPDAGECAEELIAHVKARLGAYKAPKSIVFVTDLPLTPVHKVLRRAVRQKYWPNETRQVG